MNSIHLKLGDVLNAVHLSRNSVAPVSDCLPYPDMTQVPPAFERMAHLDFAALSAGDNTARWEDYCPAYALGLLTYETYVKLASRMSEWELEAQWEELSGASCLTWQQAKPVVSRAWSVLNELDRGTLL